MNPLNRPYKIAVAGDWHMNTSWAVAAINYAANNHAEIIIHLGDFGYVYSLPFLRAVESALAERGISLVFIDGNHDWHQRITARYPMQPNGLRQLSPHVHYIPRGYGWTWQGVKLLGMGGAFSIDHRFRVAGKSWWPRTEQISDRNIHAAARGGPVDVMFSHDCPFGVPIPNLSDTAHLWKPEDLKLAESHRKRLLMVVDRVQPKLIWHGHYHRRYRLEHDFGYGPVLVSGLDCDGSSFEANVDFVYLHELQMQLEVGPYAVDEALAERS